jgi:hypothetical protein
MRVLVCGSREWDLRWPMAALLGDVYCDAAGDIEIISGMARGADMMAVEWARRHDVPVREFPADWDRYGKRAGYVRNQQMLDEGKPDLVLAFKAKPESRGTDMMIDIARKAGVSVLVVQS